MMKGDWEAEVWSLVLLEVAARRRRSSEPLFGLVLELLLTGDNVNVLALSVPGRREVWWRW